MMDTTSELHSIESKVKVIRSSINAVSAVTASEKILKHVALLALEIINELVVHIKKTSTTVH